MQIGPNDFKEIKPWIVFIVTVLFKLRVGTDLSNDFCHIAATHLTNTLEKDLGYKS